MTIAACYVSPEGIVLGADSTSSSAISPSPGLTGYHYFNFNQKVFEIGDGSTLGILTWGLGAVSVKSYRTLIALFSDALKKKAPPSVSDVADQWTDVIWGEYSSNLQAEIAQCKSLEAKQPHGKADPNNQSPERTEDEEKAFQSLKRNLVVGFCVAGYLVSDRLPSAFEIIFDPLTDKPAPSEIPLNQFRWWGAPNPIKRLIYGADDDLKASIISSGKWTGTPQELDAIVGQHLWAHPVLPIRDAVDFVHSCVYSTIKAMKFSNLFQICGGPIEIAVIRTDRPFHWVRHKEWDSAIEGI